MPVFPGPAAGMGIPGAEGREVKEVLQERGGEGCMGLVEAWRPCACCKRSMAS